MKTTAPIPNKSKFAKWFCKWFRGHSYWINEVKEQPFLGTHYWRFCRRCGDGELWKFKYGEDTEGITRRAEYPVESPFIPPVGKGF